MNTASKSSKTLTEGVFLALLPINVIGMLGFWIFYWAVKPAQTVTPGLVGTGIAELVTAIFCLWAFYLQYYKAAKAESVTLAAAGMLFFGSIQGIGDAISSQTYALVWVMGLNIVVIPLAFYERIKKVGIAAHKGDSHHHRSGVIGYDEAKHRGVSY